MSRTSRFLAAGFVLVAATLGIFLLSVFNPIHGSSSGQTASAQVASSYCDASSGICFQGITVRSCVLTVQMA